MQDKDMPGSYPALGIIPAGLGNNTARGLRNLARQFRCTAAGKHCSLRIFNWHDLLTHRMEK